MRNESGDVMEALVGPTRKGDSELCPYGVRIGAVPACSIARINDLSRCVGHGVKTLRLSLETNAFDCIELVPNLARSLLTLN